MLMGLSHTRSRPTIHLSRLPGPPEIWAYGFRNPWRFSFDRLTGDLFIADVGEKACEEIDFQPAASAGGENYGWRRMEGAHCFNPATGCNDGTLTLPIIEYPHAAVIARSRRAIGIADAILRVCLVLSVCRLLHGENPGRDRDPAGSVSSESVNDTGLSSRPSARTSRGKFTLPISHRRMARFMNSGRPSPQSGRRVEEVGAEVAL